MKKALILALACAAMAPLSAHAAAVIEVRGATFGVFDATLPGELELVPAAVVPRKTGQRYGWVIELKTTLKRVSVREEYLLPARVSAEVSLTEGKRELPKRVQVSQRALPVINGRIYGEWSVGPNEPAGPRHLQVIVENELAGDFEFEVK